MFSHQQLAQHVEHVRIIIDDQQVRAQQLLAFRQDEMESAAFTGLAFHPDMTSMQLHEFAAQIKAQSDPLLSGGISCLYLMKPIKNAIVLFRRNAASSIAD